MPQIKVTMTYKHYILLILGPRAEQNCYNHLLRTTVAFRHIELLLQMHSVTLAFFRQGLNAHASKSPQLTYCVCKPWQLKQFVSTFCLLFGQVY